MEDGALAHGGAAGEAGRVGSQLGYVVEGAAGQADGQGRHLVGDEGGHAEPEQVAAADSRPAEHIGHLGRHEDAVQGEVQAAGALQPGDVPVVDDLRLVLGHQEDDHQGHSRGGRAVASLIVRLASARLERPDQPVRVDDAA